MKFILPLILSSCALVAAPKPNFIFVLSDDIAQGDLGCYGQKLIQTPRLDQMPIFQIRRLLNSIASPSFGFPANVHFLSSICDDELVEFKDEVATRWIGVGDPFSGGDLAIAINIERGEVSSSFDMLNWIFLFGSCQNGSSSRSCSESLVIGPWF